MNQKNLTELKQYKSSYSDGVSWNGDISLSSSQIKTCQEGAITIMELDAVSKFFALAETSAHLELLVSRGSVSKAQPDGTIQYSARRGG